MNRVTREAVTIERLTIGMVGGIQPDRLGSLLMKARDDDGMLARFCPVFPQCAPIEIPVRTVDVAQVVAAFRRLHDLAMLTDAQGNLFPEYVRFDEPARNAMRDYRVWVRDMEGETQGLLKSFLGKTPGMLARVALVLGMLDWAEGGIPSRRRSSAWRCSTAPTSWWRSTYGRWRAAPMRRRRPPARSGPPARSRAGCRGSDPASLANQCFSAAPLEGLRNAGEVEAALKQLVDARILQEIKISTKGRPRFEYVVNPRIWD